MRFYLDNDVDQRCRRVLEEAGHECWATAQAGRPDADDGDQAYYAVVKGAVTATNTYLRRTSRTAHLR